MSKQEAIKILMMSPYYFKFSVEERKVLVEEFVALASGQN